jgi:hypothetical protein
MGLNVWRETKLKMKTKRRSKMEIAELKVEMKELREMAKMLNESKLVKDTIRVNGVKKAAAIESFMKGVEAVSDKDEAKLDPRVATFYNSLTAQLEGIVPEEVPVAEEDKEECPVFKKGWDPENSDCQVCEKDFPDDYTECEKAVKTKPVKGPKEKKVPKWQQAILIVIKNPEITADGLIFEMDKLPCGAYNAALSKAYVNETKFTISVLNKK